MTSSCSSMFILCCSTRRVFCVEVSKYHTLMWRFIGLLGYCSCHDDVIKWNHFPRYWPSVRGIHLSPVNSPHKGQWRGALMFSLICVWINGWVNNGEAGDLRRYRTHYDVSVMYRTKGVYCMCPWVNFRNNVLQQGAIMRHGNAQRMNVLIQIE